MQTITISELKGLIKEGDFVGHSMELKEVRTATEEGFNCYNEQHFYSFNYNNCTIAWISKEAMLSALGQSLQTFAKHCIRKAEKESE